MIGEIVGRMAEVQTPALASANEEAIRAWDTVLYERWKQYRHIFVGAVSQFSDDALESDPPTAGAPCLDVGCGFGDTTQRLAQIVGPDGFALGVDSSSRFIADAREEAAQSGVENAAFEVEDVQLANWNGEFDYVFSRLGTMFFANPVQALRAIRAALKPGGELCMIVWRRKDENAFMYEAEQVVERFLSHPEETDADTCGPGPFSMGNADTVSGQLQSAGFERITLRRGDYDYFMGDDLDEAIEVITALGPAAELIRVNEEEGEAKRPKIEAALRKLLANWTRGDGSVVGRASVWIVTARNPG